MTRANAKHRCTARRLLAGVALSALGMALPAQAQFAATIDIGTIDSSTGVQIRGEVDGDRSGYSVSGAGDFNGDGLDDVIIGAPNVDLAGPGISGAAYIVYGRSLTFPGPFELTSLNGNNGLRIVGAPGHKMCGTAVAGAGDVNGDGYDDVVIGCAPSLAQGTTYVVFGRPANGVSAVSVTSLTGANGFRVDPVAQVGRLGYAVAGAGDVNGDGFDDVAIGAPESGGSAAQRGSAFVVFGNAAAFSSAMSVSSLNGKNGFQLVGGNNGLRIGFSVSAAGDMNGDGLDDLFAGSFAEGPNNEYKRGQSFVLYGNTGKFPSLINTSSLNGANGFKVSGVEIGDYSGHRMAGGGDVNGDGRDDLVLGTRQQGATGGAFVLFGKSGSFAANFNVSQIDGANGYLLNSPVGASGYSTSVSLIGDIDGDGFDDIAYGNQYADYSATNAGSTHVHFGRFGGHGAIEDASLFDGTNGFRADGANNSHRSGGSVAGAGDFNGDGFDDLIIGARGFDSYRGASYILFGRAPIVSEIRAGAAGSQTIRGGPFTDMLFGVGGNDVLEGRGSGDLLDGSAGTNTASYEFAPDGVIANLASPGQNTGDAEGDSYTLIQGLLGSRFDDTLTGDTKANRITGGRGPDKLKGGKGKDTFTYRNVNESPLGAANRDEITDFNPGTASSAVDRIDLSAVDAKPARTAIRSSSSSAPRHSPGRASCASRNPAAISCCRPTPVAQRHRSSRSS